MPIKWLRACFTLFVFLVSTNSHAASWWADESYNHGAFQKPIPTLVELALTGEVLFIDTREPEEYEEGHLPYSINMRLVDLKSADLSSLMDYKYVVPYCLKDFRGFEVARALREKGLTNVIMMEPAGMRGWQKLGFPITTNNKSDAATLKKALDAHMKSKDLAVR